MSRPIIVGWTLPLPRRKSHAVLSEGGRIIGAVCGAPAPFLAVQRRADVPVSQRCARCVASNDWPEPEWPPSQLADGEIDTFAQCYLGNLDIDNPQEG